MLLLPAGEAVQQSHGDGLIADLVAASGLSTCSSVEAEAELLAALRLIDRTKPGVADRLRAYAERRSGRNPDLRQSLARIAQRLSTPPPVTRQVLRATEMLERYYRRTWQSS